jgi:CheY-like chemotaxis protein
VTTEPSAPLILVVDDFEDGRELVRDILIYGGFRVAEAATGPDALDMTRSLRPALLVLDLALPGIDGWEVTRRLKRDPTTNPIPILALTAHAEGAALERARTAGCDAVMTKPCAPDELIAQVRSMTAAVAPARPRHASRDP